MQKEKDMKGEKKSVKSRLDLQQRIFCVEKISYKNYYVVGLYGNCKRIRGESYNKS